MYYAKSTGGFYAKEIHGTNIPKDAVEITEEYWEKLLQEQSLGKQIVPDDKGYPILKDPPMPTQEEINAHNKKSRQKAYETETDPLFFKYQRGETTREEWLERVEEIRKRFPIE